MREIRNVIIAFFNLHEPVIYVRFHGIVGPDCLARFLNRISSVVLFIAYAIVDVALPFAARPL